MTMTNNLSGSEAILALGKQLCGSDFNISDELKLNIYKRVYENFASRIDVNSHGKGIALVGNIGVGKSTLMKIMHQLFRDTKASFYWMNATEFTDIMKERRQEDLKEVKDMYGKKFMCDLYIDDLGLGEVDIKKWGNAVNIISEILNERYELFVNTGIKTHFSSNLPYDSPGNKSLVDLYGDRIVDRLRQMCDREKWTGESLRK